MSAAESNPGTTTVETPATMTPTPPDSTTEPPRSGPSAPDVHHAPTPPDSTTEPPRSGPSAPDVHHARTPPGVATNTGGAGTGEEVPGEALFGAATPADPPRPVLNAVGRQLMDNVIVILLTGIVIAMMSFGFDSLGDRIDDTNTSLNARIDNLDNSLNARIDNLHNSLNAKIDELSRAMAENGERLARIEGFLGIGMPEQAAARAPGAALGGEPGSTPEGLAQSGGPLRGERLG